MRAIVTVIGKDTIGIIALVSQTLSRVNVNILDISQTVLGGYFTMMMLVDISNMSLGFSDASELLKKTGEEKGVDIRIMRTEIFEAMHHV